MKRKVVKHGPSTYVVSLPSAWVKKQNISKGDEIDVVEENDYLRLGTMVKPKVMEATVDISDLDRTTIINVVREFYRAGYDSLYLKFNKSTTYYQREEKALNILSVVHSEVNRLVGYEILEEGNKHCLIKDIQSTDVKNFDQALRRIFLLVNGLTREFSEAINNQDLSSLEVVEEKHDTITKFISYCMRLLNKQNIASSKTTSYYITILVYLENITDIFKHVAREIYKSNEKVDPLVKNICKEVVESIKIYSEIFYKYDKNKLQYINEQRYKIEKDVRSIPLESYPAYICMAANLLWILKILDMMKSQTMLIDIEKKF